MVIYLIVAIVAYSLGSIPFGYILLLMFRGEDVRQSGSGNIGATNVARSSPALGIATLILDAAKGYAAVYAGLMIGRWQQQSAPAPDAMVIAAAVAALFAILGHIFPVWLRFRGGKGVATGVGAFLAIAPAAVALVLLIFFLIVAASRYVSLGSIVATAAFPVLAYVLNRTKFPPGVVAVMFFSAFLIIAKHHQNIRRLLSGTEHRFELKQR